MDRLDDLSTWRLFTEIVRTESLHAASDALAIEPSSASRFLRDLEKRLGIALFIRQGRSLQLTSFGKEAYEKIIPVLALHQEALENLRGDRARMEGSIRLVTIAGIGPAEITPALIEFQKIYPDIQFELHELRAPLPQGFTTPEGLVCDVAIGYKNQDPLPGIVSRYSGEMPFIPCASPLYLKKHGIPRHPHDCLKHTGILISSPTRSATTRLVCGEQSADLHWKTRLEVHNLISAKSALLLGAGIVPDMPLFHCHQELRNQTLIPVLNGWHRPSASSYVFAREEAYAKRRVAVFVDWIAEREKRFFDELRADFAQFYV